MNIKFSLAAAACAVAISGCTHPTAVAPQFPATGVTRDALSPNPTNYVRVDLNIGKLDSKPKEGLQTNSKNEYTEKTDTDDDNNIENSNKNKKQKPKKPSAGYYARVVGWWTPNSLTNNGQLADVNIASPDYDKERRNFVERLLFGKNTTFSLVANIEVHSRLNYRTPIPLYSVSHASGSEGEGFEVNLKDIWYSPLIRVTPDTRLTTEVVAHYKQEIKTGAVSAALRVAQVAATQFAPGGNLLTSENLEQAKKGAKVWDAAISQMLGSNINEIRGGTTLVQNWQPDKVVTVSLVAPGADGAMMPERHIGSWQFKMEEPRLSLFSSAQCLKEETINGNCATNILSAISPQLVLNEQVGVDTTLIAAIRKKDWYSPSLISLASTTGDGGQFCQQILQAVDEIGLNVIDAKLVLAALPFGEPMPAAVRNKLKTDDTCKSLILPFTFTPTTSISIETQLSNGNQPSNGTQPPGSTSAPQPLNPGSPSQ